LSDAFDQRSTEGHHFRGFLLTAQLGTILKKNTEFGALATVLEVSISRFRDDEMGMVTGGYLTLRGLIKRVQLFWSPYLRGITVGEPAIASVNGLNMHPDKVEFVQLDVADEDISQPMYIVIVAL
jgi:hypothetical protein